MEDPKPSDLCFAAVEAVCVEHGIPVSRLEQAAEGWLGVALQGRQSVWKLDVKFDSDSLTQLPSIALRNPSRLLAHVGYRGTVCVSDGLGLSMDPSRRDELAAFTVLAAFNLLERWSGNEAANFEEFYNELEGYWLGLPDSIRARSTAEVDGVDRLVTAYVKKEKGTPKWYFTERDGTALLSFDTKGLAALRALYIDLPEPIAPPVYPGRVGPEFIEQVLQRMTDAQRRLWSELVGPSKNGPRLVAVLVSFPRPAGGRSIVGVSFTARNCAVDPKAPVAPLTVRRFTPSYMRERGGASLALQSKHVVVLGCGAVGAVVADALASTGVGRLTLVDGDVYTEDNVFRHLIDPFWIEFHKVIGLRYQLLQRYPGIKVDKMENWAQAWLTTANFDDIDAVVFAFGLPSLERSFGRAIRAKTDKRLPLLFTWLEPLDLGGHSVLVWSQGEGCLDCLYRDDEGQDSLAARTAFLEPNQAVSKNLTGCSSVFVPYGALQSRRTGLMAAEHLLEALTDTEPSYRFWRGEGAVATQQGLRSTPWWSEAKYLDRDEATQRVFGRPCRRCRASP